MINVEDPNQVIYYNIYRNADFSGPVIGVGTGPNQSIISYKSDGTVFKQIYYAKFTDASAGYTKPGSYKDIIKVVLTY